MTAKASKAPIEKAPSTTVGNDAHSLQVSLPQMLDLALGTPETMINTTKGGPSLQLYEYSITDSSKTTQRKRGSAADINAQVYTHDEDPQSGEAVQRTAASAPATARGKNGAEEPSGVSGVKKTAGSRRQIGAGVNDEAQSVIFVEPVLDGVTPTALGFKKLETTVLDLQQRFEALDELAKNPEMIERVRSSKSDPLSDMWHVININKRLDACEKGIEKMATMLQDLIKGEKIEIAGSADCDHLNERIVDLENQLAYLSGDVANVMATVNTKREEIPDGGAVRFASPEDEPTPGIPVKQEVKTEKPDEPSDDEERKAQAISSEGNESKDKKIPFDGDKPEPSKAVSVGKGLAATKGTANTERSIDKKPSSDNNIKGQASRTERRSVIGGVDLTGLQDSVNTLKSQMVELKENVENLNEKFVHLAESPRQNDLTPNLPVTSGANTGESANATDLIIPKSEPAASSSAEGDVAMIESSTTKRPSKVTVKNDESRAIAKDETAAASKVPENVLRELESRLDDLAREIGCVSDKLNSETIDSVAKIQALQEDVEKMNIALSRLMEEKENREFHTNALIEQIELLKTIKADKEDLEDALADKADAQAVNRKVSHDQFDAACDDLARGLEDAITKLSQQESVWQQALDEVQREIEGKLDKIEISPLKEFVNKRIKLLQEKLKALAEMKREREAAGTKKLLSDVQCISCDSNVVMRTEEGAAQYRAPGLPSTKSIKPYLTYELDQVRKQQRRLPTSRNMIQFEAAMQEMARKTKPLKEDLSAKSPRDHLCNRYCGGSHTITTPQQRVMRMGHFLAQWGPEAVQLTEGVIRGNDGQLYRSRPMLEKAGVPKLSTEAEAPAEIPPTVLRSSVPEPVVSSQRQSQVIRGRSSTATIPKRVSTRRVSEASKESKNVEVPVAPPTPPAGSATSVNEGDAVPEPPGPVDEVVRESSLENNLEEEEEMPTEAED